MRAAFTCFFMILFYQIYRIQMRIHPLKIDSQGAASNVGRNCHYLMPSLVDVCGLDGRLV
jgi:hypothetical protein